MASEDIKHQRDLKLLLAQIELLLDKQSVVSTFTARQDTPQHELVMNLLAKQQLVELERRLAQHHPADLAYVLEGLPLDRRLQIWSLVRADQRGAVLLELADAVRVSVLSNMPSQDIVSAAGHLDADQIADLVPSLPREVAAQLLNALDQKDRAEVQTVLSFPKGSIGALMELDFIHIREDVELEVVLRYLRTRRDLPDNIDQLIVIDRGGMLKGMLPLKSLLVHEPEVLVSAVMQREPIAFRTDESAHEAAAVFERYDLRTVPVVNLHHRVVGVLDVDAVLEHLNEAVYNERLSQVGLSEDEDLFGPVWKSSRNRWAWLALNLMTAFIASRVISSFEEVIHQIVALAALMPIVASVAGNSGNQTVALVIRGLAMGQLNSSNFRRLLIKELNISLVNGALWGSVVGFFALLFYGQLALACVMAVAMTLNLMIGTLIGVAGPITLHKMGRDPVMGSSVMLTAVTDSMGFFLFLGLAALVL